MSQAEKYSAPIHMNGNIVASIDIKTTGPDPELHDIVDICVLPLNEKYEPSRYFLPFNMTVHPRFPENAIPDYMRKMEKRMAEIILTGVDHYRAGDLFLEWFYKRNLGYGKKFSPLAFDWPTKKAFLLKWLGQKNFDDVFYYRYRDPIVVANHYNDIADINSENFPYPKTEYSYFISTLKIETTGSLKASLATAVTTAEIYRKILYVRRGMFS